MSDDPRGRAYDARDPLDFLPPRHDPSEDVCRCPACEAGRAEAWERASRSCPVVRLVPMALARGDELYDAEGRQIAVVYYGAEALERLRPWLERQIAECNSAQTRPAPHNRPKQHRETD